MKLYIIRHGETNYNVQGLHNSDPSVDVHLTEKGISDARRLADDLRRIQFDAVYVSEMPRTLQTAKLILEELPKHFYTDSRLNDIDTGFEGRPVEEYHRLRDASDDVYTYRFDGHESSEDVFNRVKDFLNFIKEQDYDNVLIVTSKHPFRHFRNVIDKNNPRQNNHSEVLNLEILEREWPL